MKVAYQWLKQYADTNLSPEELAARMTMVGLIVDHVEFFAAHISGVVVGEILQVDAHPEADKLVICQVNVGRETVQIVTGANNVCASQKVPVALVGAHLPDGMKIKGARLRGVESFGMMCSAKELGVDENYVSEESRGGIWILHPDAPVGEDIVKVLQLDDAVLEFELTPNRSDCLSVINIAREVAAVSGTKVRLPEISFPETDDDIHQAAAVDVIATDLCNRYVARLVRNVTLGPSPEWMQHFLRSAGIRPINNVVDISNFVMLEMGQPLHTFDYDKLAGRKIIVRRAEDGEKMLTLDGQERTFGNDTILICDAEKPVAVAGVMGGLDTEVTGETHNILIESARFQPVSIRRTSRALGLHSEASLRFEKGLDVENARNACDRAAQLMAQFCGGSVSKGVIDSYKETREPQVVRLRTPRVNEILGTALATEEVVGVMKKLQFPVTLGTDQMAVTIPAYRQDITREIDLVEEVARIIGYDRIPLTLPTGSTTQGKKTRIQVLEDTVRKAAAGAGLSEVLTYSFINPKDLDKILLPEDHPLRRVVEVQNPLSDETRVMRTTLVNGLLNTAALNTSRRNTDLAIFECGRIFLPGEGILPDERLVLAALVSGTIIRGWNWQSQNLDFYFLKGIMESIFQRLCIGDWNLSTDDLPPFLHPGRGASIRLTGKNVGWMGEIHPSVQENYDLEEKACCFQLDLASLFEAAPELSVYVPVPKFPAIQRDLALIVPDRLAAAQVAAAIREKGTELLTAVSLFDVYKGSQVPEGKKSLAYAISFQAADRTLTDEEISTVMKGIKSHLSDKFGVELR